MGCSGSKSTPVIESVTSNEAADKMIINSSIMKPAENIKDWTKDHVHDAGEDISGALKPSTPETERAADSEGSPAEKRSASPANKSEIAAVETDDGSARMTHNVEQLEKQLMDLDVPKGTKNYTQNAAQEMNVVEKPSTPMPDCRHKTVYKCMRELLHKGHIKLG